MKNIITDKHEGMKSTGIFDNNDGTFTVVTWSTSRNFKTLAGAKRWYSSRKLLASI